METVQYAGVCRCGTAINRQLESESGSGIIPPPTITVGHSCTLPPTQVDLMYQGQALNPEPTQEAD